MTHDPIRQLCILKDQALAQSGEISIQLTQGTPPDKLVPLLQKQSETIQTLQEGLQDLSKIKHIEQHSEDIKMLQQTLKELAEASQTQVQKATQKGVRLPGVGGKPHISRRPKR
jgi:endonuclease III